MTLATFTRDEVSLRYCDIGDGAAVVFQHGLGGDLAQVASIFPDEPGIRRLTLECRGHGQSDYGPHEQLAIATFADDVLALCAARGIRRAVFGGMSMGAAIAQRIAVTKPSAVAGLILVRPAWVSERAPPNMRPFAEVAEIIGRNDGPLARRRFLASDTAMRLAARAPDNLASLLALFERADATATRALIGAIALDGPGTSEAELRAISVPTLIIGHALDSIHPLAHAEALHRLIPGSRLVEVTPKAADLGAYQAEVRAACRDFLAAFVSC